MPDSQIKGFRGEYRWLSNFWPCKVVFEGEVYLSVEHAYVAAKTLEASQRKLIQKLPTAKEAKKFGKKVNLREDWEGCKKSIMKNLLQEKFQNPDLRIMLISTHPATLIEDNWWGDTYWGVCKGVGQNTLGELLMEVRREVLNASQSN